MPLFSNPPLPLFPVAAALLLAPVGAGAQPAVPAAPSTSPAQSQRPKSAAAQEPSTEDTQATEATEATETSETSDQQPPPSDEAPEETATEPTFSTVVVGASEAKTGGSLHIQNPEKLERFEYDDPQAVLQHVPGVYARGEDGFGLRPNIGLRGASSDRSKKVTLLEDGVLFGPAPYSAPAAYYFPLMTRMQAVRVLKGPSAVVHGPQTIGGSVELLTRPVPSTLSAGLDVAGGQWGSGKAHLHGGTSWERWGFFLEGVHLRSGGFKSLDGGGGTGFARDEWMAKVRRLLPAMGTLEQSVQLKLGWSHEDSDETYLGLTDEDFAATPLRRYAASAHDHMRWHRTQAQLSHRLEGRGFTLVTTAYRHDMSRTWRKVNRFGGGAIGPVLENPDTARNAQLYGVLTGELDTTGTSDTLFIGPNARSFVSQGVQTVARLDAMTGPLQHSLEFGARLHHDSIKRDHSEDAYSMVEGRLVSQGRPTSITADNRDATNALALHVMDTVGWKRFTLTPGLRAELIRSTSEDFLAGTSSEGRTNVLLPGIGAHVAVTEALGLFAGVHRGFSPPAPGSPDAQGPELAVNWEGGARWMRRGERLEAVGFFNDYSNLTDICTFSNGCLAENLDRQFAAGRARIWGVETYGEKLLRTAWGVRFPLSVTYTYTQTELLESFQSADPHFGNVRAGDELPYVPRHQGALSLSAEAMRWSAFVNANLTGAMRERAGQGETEPGELTSQIITVDVGAAYFFNPEAQLYLQARNVTDEVGITSRRPYGARPNAPRTVLVGFKYSM